jgi:ABC-type polysaccharide/polyol phosphate transport system ATPase subunit
MNIAISATKVSKSVDFTTAPFFSEDMPSFRALKDISFGIRRGESIGIIKRNGKGKPIVLQLLSGVSQQTGGELAVNSRKSALL